MAYVHFRIMDGSQSEKFDCMINGSITTFESGEYMKVKNGMLVISFDGGITRWNVQEIVSEYDCIDIQLMVGYQDSLIDKTVIGQPIYEVIHFEKNEVGFMEDSIEELRIHREAKKKETENLIVNGVLKCIFFLCGWALLVVGVIELIKAELLSAIPMLIIGAVFLLFWLFFRKK